MTFKELVLEAKVRRAWNGKLKKIDELLSWMYDKGILNKGEQSKKDTLFRKYYRWYNDGDFPRGLKNKAGSTITVGMRDELVDKALEEQLEDFIKTILSKYTGKVDRGMFKIDSALSKIKTVISVTDDFDIHGLVKYWKKDVSDEEILAKIEVLEGKYDILDEETGKTNITMSYRREKMKEKKTWTKENEASWKEIQKGMIEVSGLLNNIKTSLETMKKLRLLEK